MSSYEEHVDLSYNALFTKALAGGLAWIPWVGKEYAKAKVKVLVVGESYYAGTPADFDYYKQADATQYLIWEARFPFWNSRTFDNMERALTGVGSLGPVARGNLWEHIAHYNFVQRPMDTVSERPTWEDFFIGWKHYIEVVKVLKPDVCIFCGITAAYAFNAQMQELGIDHESVEGEEVGARSLARVASISLEDGYHLALTFMQHCSRYFSWSTWHKYLRRREHRAIAYLQEIVGYEENAEEQAAEGTPREEEDSRAASVDVPMHLGHRPIYAAKYADLTDYDPEGDAKFVSVGLAQYDSESISVKLFRYSGERWSRQSEELPVYRALIPAIALLKTIAATQNGGTDSVMPFVLKDPSHLETLTNAMGEPALRTLLTRHIEELKELIAEIDTDRIGIPPGGSISRKED